MKRTFTLCAVVLVALFSFSVALNATISLQELRDIMLLADGSEVWTGDMNADGNSITNLASVMTIVDVTQYVSLTAAIAALPDHGGIVFFPPGSVTDAHEVYIDKPRVYLVGPSSGIGSACQLRYDGDGGPGTYTLMFDYSDSTWQWAGGVQGLYFVDHIEEGTPAEIAILVDNLAGGEPYDTRGGFLAHGVFRDNYFANFDIAIQFNGQCFTNSIINNVFDAQYEIGLDLNEQARLNLITMNRWRGCQGYTIDIEVAASVNTIIKNQIENAVDFDNPIRIQASLTKVIDNHFERWGLTTVSGGLEATQAAILITGDPTMVQILSNNFQSDSDREEGVAIDIDSGTVIIEGNFINNLTWKGWTIAAGAEVFDRNNDNRADTPVTGGVEHFEGRIIEYRILDKDTSHTTDTGVGGELRIPFAISIIDVGAYVDTAGTGSLTTLDINEAGTTILSTKITIDATEKTSTTAATPAVISDAIIAADAIITFDIDGIASGTAGKGLVIWLKGY